jgi:hypothetical protein
MPAQPPLNEYDVGEEITLSCLFLAGQTVGRMEKGQTTVYVRDASGLDLTPLSELVVVGAGYVGGDLRTTVVSDDGQGAIVVADAARQTVVETAVGTPANPNPVVCIVKQPDATTPEVTVTVSPTEVGFWQGVFTPTVDGDHFYAFNDKWRKFFVRPDRVP